MSLFSSCLACFAKAPAGKPEQQQKPQKKISSGAQEEAVITKLKKGNKQAQSMPEDELREWARSLCIKEDLIEWYLNPEFATTIKLFDKLEEVQQNAPNGPVKGGLNFASKSEVVETAPKNKIDDDDAFNDIDFNISDIKKESEQSYMKVGKKIKIKLVVAEICKSDAQKAVRKMLSPILTKLDLQQQFGMFHSALVIGPWYLEWNNSSLCIPRKCYSSAAMLACDLEFGGKLGKVGFDLDDTIQKVSDVIIDWNVNRAYDQRTANCQQIVDEVCKALGIDLNFQGPLGEYLNRLRESGQCDLSYTLDDDVRQSYNIKDKVKQFHTHRDLDEFIYYLLEQNPEFEDKHPMEWGLLKSFDRAFWLRHFKNPEDKKFQQHEKECPFKDPTITASIKKDWW
jgi:hypothetical protein